jgi:hypothetical protein
MKRLRVVAVVAFALLAAVGGVHKLRAAGGGQLPPGSQRQSTLLTAILHGYEEVPAVSSTGSGTFRASIASDDSSIEYELQYENLEGVATLASHVHLGQPDVNGGVMFFLCGGGGKPLCPPTSATIEGIVVPADVIGPSGQGIAAGEFEEALRALRLGATYVNVHTNKHPGGEIRGAIK